jgi:hypothetical protein
MTRRFHRHGGDECNGAQLRIRLIQIKTHWQFRSTIWRTSTRLRAGIAGSGAEDDRAVRGVSAHHWGLDGGITAAKG